MPALNPPPTIDSNLGLIVLPLTTSASLRVAEITFAVNCGAHDLATAQDAVDDFQANITAQFGGTWAADVSYGPASIKVGDGSTVPVEAIAAAGQVAGAGSTEYLSANIACLVKKATGLGGKKNRGRTYWPYLIDSAHIVEPGTLDGAELTAIQTKMTAFFNQLVTDATPMVIANRTLGGAPIHVTAVTMGPQVTSYTVSQVLATQRRRLRG